ncbi:MAG: CRISPR-associated helicase Cas3' [Candidatus Calescibacterium sp.]|nr:CRISPR-associated helicase Cas3' [Candidatus Calescibacterium sp.]MDW8087429.1 CRISPR-associated helicase Cas3' [Candidatus Calescibacterium sp.]
MSACGHICSGLFSHTGICLENHLLDVADLCVRFHKQNSLSLFEPEEKVEDLLWLVGLCHDIGKSTEYFQEYLTQKEYITQKVKGDTKLLRKHSLLSAVCSYFLVKQKTQNDFLAFVGYLAVKRHHSNLDDILNETSYIDDKELRILEKQIQSIDDKKLEAFSKNLSVDLTKERIRSWCNEIQKELFELKRKFRNRNGNLTDYLKINYIFSILLDADKSAVVLGGRSRFEDYFSRKDLDLSCVDRYVDSLKQSGARKMNRGSNINDLRNQAYNSVSNFEIDLSQRIFSMNLPTGLGKTLMALKFALKIRQNLETKKGIKARIIYSLPFLSIIDQTFSVFTKVLNNPTSDILLQHHHLSDMVYTKQNNGEQIEYEDDQAKIMLEGWNSEIIVTTFYQLFQTLVSNSKSNIRKFHRLANSIIILDEVQCIPHRYWSLVKELMISLTEKMNSYVILVTATQPMIFGQSTKIIDERQYFNSLNRVDVYIDITPKTIPEFAKQISFEEGKSYLFILNTINSAKELYSILKNDILKDGFRREIVFLSSHIVPRERLMRIEKIKRGEFRIAVTTQVIEAGVDVSFDVVYRDLAPLDSINQACGRCNRNWEKESGKVFILKLKDERRAFASYVYDSILLESTEEILKPIDSSKIREQDFLQLVGKYFDMVNQRKSNNISRQLLDSIKQLRYDGEAEKMPISSFKLIEDERFPKISVFVEINREAKSVWEDYKKIWENNNLKPFEKMKEFEKIKSKFYDFVISVPCFSSLPPIVCGIGYISSNQLEDYYDLETGYKISGDAIIW